MLDTAGPAEDNPQATNEEEVTSSSPRENAPSGSESEDYHTAEEVDSVDDHASEHSSDVYDPWTWNERYRNPKKRKEKWFVVLVGRETGIFKHGSVNRFFPPSKLLIFP